MSWSHQIEGPVPDVLDELDLDGLAEPEGEVKREQLAAAVAVVPTLLDAVADGGYVLITLTGHTNPDEEEFAPCHVGVTVSRVDPKAFEQRAEGERQKAERIARIVDEAHAAALEENERRDEEPAAEPAS